MALIGCCPAVLLRTAALAWDPQQPLSGGCLRNRCARQQLGAMRHSMSVKPEPERKGACLLGRLVQGVVGAHGCQVSANRLFEEGALHNVCDTSLAVLCCGKPLHQTAIPWTELA